MPYSTKEESNELFDKDTRSTSVKTLDKLISQKEDEGYAETAIYLVALDLVEKYVTQKV